MLVFISLVSFYSCQPGTNNSRALEQGAIGADGLGDETGGDGKNLEDTCQSNKNEGAREALRNLLPVGSASYNSYIKGYLENKGCQTTKVYTDFVASAHLTGGFADDGDDANAN